MQSLGQNIMSYVRNRLCEPSTWRGIIWCLSAFGIWNFSYDQAEAFISLSMALAGGIGIIAPDRK